MRARGSVAGAVAAVAAAALGWGVPGSGWAQGGSYVNFETIPNRALALSPDGTRLFVTNTPDSRLEILNVGSDGKLTPAGSVTVGLDPVAVSARTNTEVWVVNQLSDSVSRQTVFLGPGVTDVVFVCQDCHGLDPSKGQFGTRGEDVVEGETQFFKVTQLRTVYDKVGMFGHNFGDNGDARTLGGPRTKVGPQVRGTGTLHDGSAAGPEEFLTAGVFQLNATQLKNVVDFVFAFPTNMAPIVGQQATLRADSGMDVQGRIDLLEQRAGTAFVMPGNLTKTECDLVAKAEVSGKARGFLFQPQQRNFLSDDGRTMTDAELRSLARTPGQEVTFTCVYPGGGRRIGIDRMDDGKLDRSAGM
jgi:hypothetical protein